MMLQNVIIWGTGSGFLKRKESLSQLYNIIAVTDSSGKTGYFEGFPRIFPHEIKNYSFDRIIVCSINYYDTIKYRLMNELNIPSEQILGVGFSENYFAQQTVYESVDKFSNLNKRNDFVINPDDLYLISNDYCESAGKPETHYFAQDIWGARKIFRSGVAEHYDIGSSLNGFLAHLLVFCPKVHYIDIRPLPFNIPHLEFVQGNATDLKTIKDESIHSLSSFHAIEHFGLGRYGDPLDPDACFKALNNMERILSPKGRLYLGVPIGPENKLIFNAHRIFRPETIINAFTTLNLVEFSVIVNDNCLEQQIPLEQIASTSDILPEYSCGLFEFTKRA